MAATVNRRWLLAARPSGNLKDSDFELSNAPRVADFYLDCRSSIKQFGCNSDVRFLLIDNFNFAVNRVDAA